VDGRSPNNPSGPASGPSSSDIQLNRASASAARAGQAPGLSDEQLDVFADQSLLLIVHLSGLIRVCPQPLARGGDQEMVCPYRDLSQVSWSEVRRLVLTLPLP
jgi:hypothetical protein